MMFEKISQQLHKKVTQQGLSLSTTDEIDVFPVSSLEEVAIQLRNEDENSRYDYYLVQISRSKKVGADSKRVVPPPFNPGPKASLEPAPIISQYTNQEPTFELSRADVQQAETPKPVMNEMQNGTGAVAANPRTEAARPDRDDVPFLIENADILFKSGETELARNIYRAILKTGESSEIAYAGLASCADRDGLIEQAIQLAWDSVAFAPNQKGYQLLAQLLVQQGRDQEAAQTLNRALKQLSDLSSKEKGEYYKMIGNCHSRLGQTQDAERAYKKALEFSPASDEAQSNLGSLYLEQGQVADAKRCYQDALAANPNNDKAWVGLGLCCVTEGDKESAHDAFARSLEKNMRNSTAIFHLVKCAYEIKRYGTAEKILSQYVEVAPVSPSLLYSLAGLQFHTGKKDNALNTARRILQMKPDHSGAKDLILRIESV
jgi:tetratricopeptide (TPR) repeat protein